MPDNDTDVTSDEAPCYEVAIFALTFPIGRLLATPGALRALENAGQSAADFLARHVSRDWGELTSEDIRLNNYAADQEERLLSAYTMADGIKIWIITEADRKSTTLLLPSEY